MRSSRPVGSWPSKSTRRSDSSMTTDLRRCSTSLRFRNRPAESLRPSMRAISGSVPRSAIRMWRRPAVAVCSGYQTLAVMSSTSGNSAASMPRSS